MACDRSREEHLKTSLVPLLHQLCCSVFHGAQIVQVTGNLNFKVNFRDSLTLNIKKSFYPIGPSAQRVKLDQIDRNSQLKHNEVSSESQHTGNKATGAMNIQISSVHSTANVALSVPDPGIVHGVQEPAVEDEQTQENPMRLEISAVHSFPDADTSITESLINPLQPAPEAEEDQSSMNLKITSVETCPKVPNQLEFTSESVPCTQGLNSPSENADGTMNIKIAAVHTGQMSSSAAKYLPNPDVTEAAENHTVSQPQVPTPVAFMSETETVTQGDEQSEDHGTSESMGSAGQPGQTVQQQAMTESPEGEQIEHMIVENDKGEIVERVYINAVAEDHISSGSRHGQLDKPGASTSSSVPVAVYQGQGSEDDHSSDDSDEECELEMDETMQTWRKVPSTSGQSTSTSKATTQSAGLNIPQVGALQKLPVLGHVYPYPLLGPMATPDLVMRLRQRIAEAQSYGFLGGRIAEANSNKDAASANDAEKVESTSPPEAVPEAMDADNSDEDSQIVELDLSASGKVAGVATLENGLFQCSQCTFQTKSRGSLLSHLRKHGGMDTKRIRCLFCRMKFPNESYLENHVREKHGNQKNYIYMCTQCGKRFCYKQSLERHVNGVHKGVFQWRCEHCNKGFHKRRRYEEHMYRHAGVKPEECEYCGKKFTKQEVRKRHERICKGTIGYEDQK